MSLNFILSSDSSLFKKPIVYQNAKIFCKTSIIICNRRSNIYSYSNFVYIATPMPYITSSRIPGLTTLPIFSCAGKRNGFYANPASCSSYFICAGSQSFVIKCATGLMFNTVTQYCDYPRNVQCINTQSNVSMIPSTTAYPPNTHRKTQSSILTSPASTTAAATTSLPMPTSPRTQSTLPMTTKTSPTTTIRNPSAQMTTLAPSIAALTNTGMSK